jgi:serine/threonine protein kinase
MRVGAQLFAAILFLNGKPVPMSDHTRPNPVISDMRDVLCGPEYLHRSGVCHRDIKSENMLVSLEGRCRITDYDASKVLRSSIAGVSTMLNTFVTPFYVAPEVVRGESYGRSADIWSVLRAAH